MPLKISDCRGLLSSRKGKTAVVIAGVLMILLLFFSTLSADEPAAAPAEDTAAVERELEHRLEQLLSGMDGVSSPDVMVTLESTSETVFARDSSVSTGGSGGSDRESSVVLAGSGKSALEQSVILPRVRGVAVVCGGAENPAIKEKVVNAVSGVLDISSSRVYVTN